MLSLHGSSLLLLLFAVSVRLCFVQVVGVAAARSVGAVAAGVAVVVVVAAAGVFVVGGVSAASISAFRFWSAIASILCRLVAFMYIVGGIRHGKPRELVFRSQYRLHKVFDTICVSQLEESLPLTTKNPLQSELKHLSRG